MPDKPDNIVPITPGVRTAVEQFGAEHDLQLLTILFTDLVDSTRLQSELGNIEAARLTERHRKIVRDELAKYNAREIEWAGDSCLAVFPKPSDAVLFALKMQAKHRRVRETEPKLPLVRVGMHLGEIVVKKRDDGGKKSEDLFGLQVSEAARVMSVARGNQIYCTRAVFDNAKGSLKGSTIDGVGDVVWVSYGAFMLKGSEDPVELCEVGSSEVAVLKAPQPSEKVRPLAPESSEPGPPSAHQSIPWKTAAVIAALLVVVAVLLTMLVSQEPSGETQTADSPTPSLELAAPDEPKPIRRFALALRPDEPLRAAGFAFSIVALSPDGSLMVYVGEIDGERMLVTRRLDQLDTLILPGTEGAEDPFFSPDGNWIAFFADRKLKKIRADGGAPVALADCTFPVRGHWLESDEILFAPAIAAGIYRVSADGGPAEPLVERQEGAVQRNNFYPHMLPGGNALLFTSSPVPDINRANIILRDLDTGEERILANGAVRPLYAPTGHIVYVQEGRVSAIPFNVDSLEETGPPTEVSEDLMTDLVSAPFEFAFSQEGTLVYAPGGTSTTLNVRRSLVWVDRQGNAEPVNAPIRPYGGPRFSPDGTRVAVDIRGSDGIDVWVLDLNRGTVTPVTTHNLVDWQPGWHPDGRHLLFSSNRDGNRYSLFRMLADGSSAPEPVTSGPLGQFTPSFTPNGDTLLYSQLSDDEGFDVYVLPMDGDSEPRALIKTRFREGNAVVSPDGKWVAYSSDVSGQREIYVQAYPDLDQRTQISPDGGRSPVWGPDSSELFYRSPTAMMVVNIQPSSELEAGIPEVLFLDDYFLDPNQSRTYDVSPLDGRFLMMREIADDETDPRNELMLVENWFEELKRRAPHPETN